MEGVREIPREPKYKEWRMEQEVLHGAKGKANDMFKFHLPHA